MKRRDFIKNSALASSVFFVPSFVRAFEDVAISNYGFKRLVIVQLSGGNDGLNTIIPYRNDIYYSCLLYTSPSPRDLSTSRMPSSA